MEEPADDGEEDNEVADLDSLVRLFNQLTDASTSQENAETSQASNLEVNPSYSDLEPFISKRKR